MAVLSKIRARATYANVIATLALFVALGGGAYAALSKNSVKSKQIARNAVKAPEVAKNAVGSSELRNGQVGGAEIGDGAVGGRHVDESSLSQVPDAARLGGLGPGDFLPAGNVRSGAGVASATSDDVIVPLTDLQATLLTDGDADDDFSLRVRNDRPPEGGNIVFVCGGGFASVAPGTSSIRTTGTLYTGASCHVYDPSSVGSTPIHYLFCGYLPLAAPDDQVGCVDVRGSA